MNYVTDPEEMVLCIQIAERATAMAAERDVDYPLHAAFTDIQLAHCNGCAVDLKALHAARNGDFAHDVFGIRQHIDRQTGLIKGPFLPRYAKFESDAPAERFCMR